MNTITHMNILLLVLIVYIGTIPRHVHALTYHNRKSFERPGMEQYMLDNPFSSIDEDRLVENTPPIDSAEKYFDWASKTNRPMEYWRGKRFWLFTKKEEQGNQHDTIANGNRQAGLSRLGVWRSGIVGRR